MLAWLVDDDIAAAVLGLREFDPPHRLETPGHEDLVRVDGRQAHKVVVTAKLFGQRQRSGKKGGR